eukprot:9469773-Pyramimonas_sp.AAC.1
MTTDGISHATTALAVHVFTMMPSGEIDVLGVRAEDILIIGRTHIHAQWSSFLNPDTSRDTVVDEDSGDLVINAD